ncbi:hypothetical protein Tco_1049734 [Tanacetum coccineum]
MRPLPSAVCLLVSLKTLSKRSSIRNMLEGNIPSTTSAADVAATWASVRETVAMSLRFGSQYEVSTRDNHCLQQLSVLGAGSNAIIGLYEAVRVLQMTKIPLDLEL